MACEKMAEQMALDLLETDDETGQPIVVNMAPSVSRLIAEQEADGSTPGDGVPKDDVSQPPPISVHNRLFIGTSADAQKPSCSSDPSMLGPTAFNKMFDDVHRANLEPIGHQLPIGSPRQRRSPPPFDAVHMRTKRASSSHDEASRDSFIDNLPKSLDEFAECETVQSQRRASNQGETPGTTMRNTSMSSLNCPLSPSHTITLSVTTNNSPSPPLDDDDLEVSWRCVKFLILYI